MGQRLIEDVPPPNVVESVDVQGHAKPIPGKAGCCPLDITSWGVAAGNYPSLSETETAPCLTLLMKRRQGQGGFSPEAPVPRRAVVKSIPPFARSRAT